MSFIQEFKAFAMRGNVIDLAVGVVIGAAFGKIVSSLVDDLIMPLLGLVTGKIDFSALFIVLSKPEGAAEHFKTIKAAKNAGATVLSYGLFLNSVFQFVIVAFAIFIVIKQLARLKNAEPAAKPETPRQEILLEEIRDLLKK